MTTNPNPECELDCRFEYGIGVQTCMYYHPVYDKFGNNVNPDGNITSGNVKCQTCGKEWRYSTQFDETTFRELP